MINSLATMKILFLLQNDKYDKNKTLDTRAEAHELKLGHTIHCTVEENTFVRNLVIQSA